MSDTSPSIDPLKSRWRELPLELINAIATELGGDEVLRLRQESLPFDFSSDFILYNALISIEKWPEWASIRKTLYAHSDDDDEVVERELREREALYWQHKKGVPHKLIAKAETYIHPNDWPTRQEHRPVLRFGRLAYVTQNPTTATACIVVRDLVANKHIKVLARGLVTAMTITKTTLAYAIFDQLHVIPLENLDNSIRDERETDPCFESKQRIYGLAGHEDLIAFLAGHHDSTSKLMYLVKGESPKLVDEVDANAALEVDWNHFLVFEGYHTSYQQLRLYSFDGDCFGKKRVDCTYGYGGYLRSNGTQWTCVDTSWYRQGVLERPAWSVEPPQAVVWKERMYLAHSGSVRISTINQREKTIQLGKLIGNLAYLDHAKLELLIDDTFLVVRQSDKQDSVQRWFVFTFDNLPGKEIGGEVAGDEYFWLPARRKVDENTTASDGALLDGVDAESITDSEGWTFYGISEKVGTDKKDGGGKKDGVDAKKRH